MKKRHTSLADRLGTISAEDLTKALSATAQADKHLRMSRSDSDNVAETLGVLDAVEKIPGELLTRMAARLHGEPKQSFSFAENGCPVDAPFGAGEGWSLRSFVDRLLSTHGKEAYTGSVGGFPLIEIPGSGVPITAAATRTITHAFRLPGDVDFDLCVMWSSTLIELRWSARPSLPQNVSLFFEDNEGHTPLAAIMLASGTANNKSARIVAERLGFDPCGQGWRLRLALD